MEDLSFWDQNGLEGGCHWRSSHVVAGSPQSQDLLHAVERQTSGDPFVLSLLLCLHLFLPLYISIYSSLFSDHLPQPLMMVESPLGEVMAGELLSIICKAPGNVTIRRFHFYRDGREVLPVAEGSEDNAADHGGSLRTSMVLQFPRAGPQHSGNFTCKYEEKKPERWIPSFTSQAVSISVNPPKKGELAIHPLT